MPFGVVVGPFLSIVVEQTHILPIDGVSLSVFDITDSRNLEWEQSGFLKLI